MPTQESPSILRIITVGIALALCVLVITNLGFLIEISNHGLSVVDYLPIIDPFYFVLPIGLGLCLYFVWKSIRGGYLLRNLQYQNNVIRFQHQRSNRYSGLACLELQNYVPDQGERPTFFYLPLETLHQRLDSQTELAMDIGIRHHLASIRFFVFQRNCRENEIEQKLTQELQKIQDAFQQAYPNLEIKQLTDNKLREAFNQITNGEVLDFDLKPKQLLLLTETGTKFLSVLQLKGNPSERLDFNRPLDLFIRSLLKMNIHTNLVMSFRPRKNDFIRRLTLRKQYRDLESEFRTSDFLMTSRQGSRDQLNEAYSAYIAQGYWATDAYMILQSNALEQHELNKDRIQTIIINTFSSIDKPLVINELSKRTILTKLGRILTRGNLSDFRQNKLSSKELSHFVHLPEYVTPGVERIQVPEFQVPPPEAGDISLGNVFFKGTTLYPAKMATEDLRLHTTVLGQTGFGKSYFVFSLIQQIMQTSPDLNWIVFDWKGEYAGLLENTLVPVTVFKPGSPDDGFHLNMFNPQYQTPDEYAQQVFDIITEVFTGIFETQTMELSVQMKRVFRELLIKVISDPKKQSLPAFLKELGSYRNPKISHLSGTIEALKTRLHRLTVGALGKIFMRPSNPINIADLISSKVVIDLSYLKQNGSISDVRLFMNLLAKQIFNYWIAQGNADHLRYLMFIEEAQYLLPEIILKKTAIDLSIIESAAHSIRSVGVGLVSIATRPIISQHVLANSALKIIFRSGYESEKIRRAIGLSDPQEQYLRSLPIQQAICIHPKWPHPFLLRIPDIDRPLIPPEHSKLSHVSFLKKQQRNYQHVSPLDPIKLPEITSSTMIDNIPQSPSTTSTPLPSSIINNLDSSPLEYYQGILKSNFETTPILSLEEVSLLFKQPINSSRKIMDQLVVLQLVRTSLIPNWKDPQGVTVIYYDHRLQIDPIKAFMQRTFFDLCRTKQLVVDEDAPEFDGIINEIIPAISLTEDQITDSTNLVEYVSTKMQKAHVFGFEYILLLLPLSITEFEMPFEMVKDETLQVLFVPFALTAYQQIIQAIKQGNRAWLHPFLKPSVAS